jgi:Mg2+/Co2+ transporter CorB
VIVTVLAPITSTIQAIVRATLRPFGVDLSQSISGADHEEELRGAIDLHDGEDPEIRHERAMLRSILDLDDAEVGEIMTHRGKVEMIDLDEPIEECVDQLLASPYTRLPVYRGDQDDIQGVLHAKAVLRALHAAHGDVAKLDLNDLSVDAWFIPENTNLLDQLQAFRQRRAHFAVVVDEYGAFLGIITLEDILEQIVGEIDDETDINSVPGVRPQADGSYLVEGTVPLRSLERDLEWDLSDDLASTVAGLVLHEARLIPDPGQIFIFQGYRFEVLRRQRNQITLLRVTPPDPDPEDDDD